MFLGDSSLRSSLDPLVFEDAADNNALNLGLVMASGIMSDYYMVERYLGTQSAPNAIVLVHTRGRYNRVSVKRLHDTLSSFTENHKLYFEHFQFF